MLGVLKTMVALGLAGQVLEAGVACSSTAKVAPDPEAKAYAASGTPRTPVPDAPAPGPSAQAAPDPGQKPSGRGDAQASFVVSALRAIVAVAADQRGWDAWERSHGFSVINGSKAPWHLIPDPASSPLRVQAEDCEGLDDGGLIVPPGKAIRIAFQSEPGAHERRAVFSIRDQDNHMGARILFTATPPAPAKGTQLLVLEDLIGRTYLDSDVLVCEGEKGIVGIKGDRYL